MSFCSFYALDPLPPTQGFEFALPKKRADARQIGSSQLGAPVKFQKIQQQQKMLCFDPKRKKKGSNTRNPLWGLLSYYEKKRPFIVLLWTQKKNLFGVKRSPYNSFWANFDFKTFVQPVKHFWIISCNFIYIQILRAVSATLFKRKKCHKAKNNVYFLEEN